MSDDRVSKTQKYETELIFLDAGLDKGCARKENIKYPDLALFPLNR